MEKLKLNQNQNRELRMYTFIVKSPQYDILVNGKPSLKEEVTMIFSYDLDQAYNNIQKTTAGKADIMVVMAGARNVKDLFELIDREEKQAVIELPPMSEKTATPEVMALENFKHSLQLAADQYITDLDDKETLKIIIEKIK